VYSPTIAPTGETQTVGEYTHPTLKDCGVIPAQALGGTILEGEFMFKSRMILAALISGVLLAGCKKEQPKAPTPPGGPATRNAPTGPTVTAPTPRAVPTPPATPGPAVTVTPSPAPTLSSPSTLDVPTTPKPPATATTPPAVPPFTAPPGSTTPAPVTSTTPDKTSATGDAQADAKSTLSQFQTHMQAKNWDAAGADLKKLKGMKDQLPPQLKQAIDKAQTSFTAAKTADRLKIPGFGTPASAPSNSEPNK
jgi:hypothetical protein